MGLFSRQEDVRGERTAEERAYHRALREARRKGQPDPEPPWGSAPPEVEPVAARLPAPEPEPEPEPQPDPEPEPEPAASAPLTWDLTEEWEAVGETEPPHGDPLRPEPAEDPVVEPEPDEETPPHGDPLMPEVDDEPAPAAI